MNQIRDKFNFFLKWLLTRIALIYVLLAIFLLSVVDLKAADGRIKARRLNEGRPEFSSLVMFSKGHLQEPVDWGAYKKYFELVLRYIPDDIVSKELLGYVCYYMGQEEKAISLLTSSATVTDDFLWPNYNLGVIYYKRGMHAQTVEYLLKVIQAKPIWTLNFMRSSLIYSQIFASPRFNFNLKNEVTDVFGASYVMIADSFWHMRQFEKMLMLAVAGIENKELPHKDALYFYAGLASLELKQIDQAVLFFEKSLALQQDNPMTYFYLARIYKAVGKEEVAEKLLNVYRNLSVKYQEQYPYTKQMRLRFF